jgi:endonuclease-3
MAARLDLQTVLDSLPRPPDDGAPRDAYGQVLWENIGYLIDDERRAALYAEFETRVGLKPRHILQAEQSTLLDLARRGGMQPEVRIARWNQIAEITLGPSHGDLDQTLRIMPTPDARALLKRYPAIGDPGADKILLFAGISPRPSLESNGVRALIRLGFVTDGAAYAAVWRAAVRVLAEQGRPGFDWLTDAYLKLRAHGRQTCRRSEPLCLRCPLDESCAHAPASF